MVLEIINGGLLSTIQDLGRNGFRRFGINPNGAMDKNAMRLINLLLGNDENAAVIEMHFPAAVIQFCEETVFALGGADLAASLDGHEIPNWKAIKACAGQKLQFKEKRSGSRLYFAACGGVKVEKWLGSASTNLQAKIGGFHGRSLTKGDVIELGAATKDPVFGRSVSFSLVPNFDDRHIIRITAANEFDMLTGASEEVFLSSQFTILNDSNRMGYRLGGADLFLIDKIEMVSSAVEFGTIQLLPNGQMVILMADHQTTGGYPRIGNVVSRDLSLLAQLGAGDKITFELVSHRAAEEINAKFESELDVFRSGAGLFSGR